MRLRQLSLDFFGHFAGKSYDFGPRREGAADFHIIHGPNEAGKTTTMEAYLRLIYGFAAREPYDFQHQRKNLRVSGTFETTNGDLSFSRLPTRSGSLVDANGNTLAQSAIDAHLGGLQMVDYRKLLCLDDQTIEQGGEEIANSKGDIGRLLFSAAAGISDLSAVLDQVDQDAKSLYLKRASKSEMAVLKKELAELTAQINANDVPAATYKKLRQDLAQATRTETDIRAKRQEIAAQLSAAKAKQNSIGLLHKLIQAEAQLKPLADFPRDLEITTDQLVEMQLLQHETTKNLERLETTQKDAQGALDQIVLRADLPALEMGIHDLEDLRNRYVPAQNDLPRRRAKLQEIATDMQGAAIELGASCPPQELVLPASVLADLDLKRQAKIAADRTLAEQTKERDTLATRIAQARDALSGHAANNADDQDIQNILDRFSVDRLAPAFAKASEAIRAANERYRNALADLAIAGQEFETVPTLVVPASDIDTIVGRYADTSQKITTTMSEIDTLRVELAAQNARILQMQQDGSLIDDATARDQIARRDALWQSHRDTLDTHSADAFEDALKHTDDIAQQRLSQAADLGQLRQITQNRDETAARLQELENRHKRQTQDQQGLLDELHEIASQMGLNTPPSPDSLRQWVARVVVAHDAAQNEQLVRRTHADTLGKAERLIAALAKHIDLDTPDFDTLLSEANRRAERAREHRERHKSDQRALDDLNTQKQQRDQQYSDSIAHAKAASNDWQQFVAKHLKSAVQPAQLERSIEPLRTLRELGEAATGLERQISTMKADQSNFAEQVDTLATRHGANDSGDDPLATYAALLGLLREGQAAQTQHADLTQTIAKTAQEIEQAKATIREVADQVDAIGRLFPEHVQTITIDDLRAAVRDADKANQLRSEITDLETQLGVNLNIPDPAQARAEIEAAVPSELDALVSQLQSDLDTTEGDFQTAIAARGSAQRDLQSVTGDGVVAELTERKATVVLAMQDTALRYAELRAGHLLAQEAIRRYRDSHRSAMMDATQQAFCDLTNGAYTTLQTTPDGANETLIAIDDAGRAKQAGDMSKATRLQLYLALRAAAYEQLVQQGTSLPFFGDDIFESFDENRTKAACKMMERIGHRGQAIYLTHHQHVVDIAREVCGDSVRVHQI
ncbi:YhaN family protein [Loktanella sp. S4079]|uniref:YhaN family protein n=1 Tax=Loktanella sp. S4079 TaxID=579483 RepID=UPI0005F9DDED|nr:YhaN family protein [Loktanella sp. S4079]KJZ18316.1 hypothetical protein TW80_15440 [Loktanella sp. S4079]